MRKYLITLVIFFTPLSAFSAQTIAEKKAGLQRGTAELDAESQTLLVRFNQEITDKKDQIRQLFAKAQKFHDDQAQPEEFEKLLDQIKKIREDIVNLEKEWQITASRTGEGDRYALWHQPETTLEQLVIDYGAQDYVYLIPPEVSVIKLSVNSNFPVPRAVWSGMLEQILNQNGVGFRQLNPFLRELYLVKEGGVPVRYITSDPHDLEIRQQNERIAYILTPDPSDVRRIFIFLEKFANVKTTTIQLVGREILFIAQVGDIRDLIKMYDFIAAHRSSKEYRLIPLSKVKAEEMAKILNAMFDQMIDLTKQKGPIPLRGDVEDPETNGLKVVIIANMSQALFLVGTKDEIDTAEKMIRDVEKGLKVQRRKQSTGIL